VADRHHPKRSLGQNFLVDKNYIRKIIDAVEPGPSDLVLEIGPGRGALTEELVKSGTNVVAIELDRDLVPDLEAEFSQAGNFQVVHGDVLKADLGSIVGRSSGVRKVVANLPYYISTAVLQKLISERALFDCFVLMFQREVVERITARPGSSDRGYLTVLAEAFMSVEHLFDVPPAAFRPVPKVWSAVVKLTPKQGELDGNEAAFEKLISAAFRQKRKTILNNLKASASSLAIDDPAALIESAGLETNRRAESLSMDEWVHMFSAFRG
jgi:16S rRNA (adenine1518-N6/adenine1519-N6)-dimethyltransferase